MLNYQRVNLHFPMVFLWFSHFPMVFPWFSHPVAPHPTARSLGFSALRVRWHSAAVVLHSAFRPSAPLGPSIASRRFGVFLGTGAVVIQLTSSEGAKTLIKTLEIADSGHLNGHFPIKPCFEGRLCWLESVILKVFHVQMSSVQNPSVSPFNPGWFVGIPRFWVLIIPSILSSIIWVNYSNSLT